MNNNKITSLDTPVSDGDACTKGYCDESFDCAFSGASNTTTLNYDYDGTTAKRICLSGSDCNTALDGTTIAGATINGIISIRGWVSDGTNKYPVPWHGSSTDFCYAFINSSNALEGAVYTNFNSNYRITIDYY